MELIRIATAAKRLGITRQNLYKRIKRDKLPVFDIDGTQFIDWDTLKYEVERQPNKNEKKPKK